MKKLYKLEVFELFEIFGVTFKHIWIKNCFVSSKRLLDNEFNCCWTDLEFNPWKRWNIHRKWFRKLRNKGFFDICVIVVIFLQNCSIFPEQRYYTTNLSVVERIQLFDSWKLSKIRQKFEKGEKLINLGTFVVFGRNLSFFSFKKMPLFSHKCLLDNIFFLFWPFSTFLSTKFIENLTKTAWKRWKLGKNAVLAIFVVILRVRLLNSMGESLSFGCKFGSYQIWWKTRLIWVFYFAIWNIDRN